MPNEAKSDRDDRLLLAALYRAMADALECLDDGTILMWPNGLCVSLPEGADKLTAVTPILATAISERPGMLQAVFRNALNEQAEPVRRQVAVRAWLGKTVDAINVLNSIKVAT